MAAPLGIAARALLQAAVSLTQQSRSDLKRAARGIDINFELLGDKELTRKLKTLEPKIQRKIARKALRTGAKTFQKEIKARAPTDGGALRKSIKVRAIKRRRNTIGSQVLIGVGLTYSSFQELGTSRIEQSRFVRQSVDDLRGQVIRDIADQLGRGIAEEAGRNV